MTQFSSVYEVFGQSLILLHHSLPWDPPTGYQIATKVTLTQIGIQAQPDIQDFHDNQHSQQFMFCCERCLHLGPPQDIYRDIRKDASVPWSQSKC
jgi:hypothetical protein